MKPNQLLEWEVEHRVGLCQTWEGSLSDKQNRNGSQRLKSDIYIIQCVRTRKIVKKLDVCTPRLLNKAAVLPTESLLSYFLNIEKILF
jgi:hypothetical protein